MKTSAKSASIKSDPAWRSWPNRPLSRVPDTSGAAELAEKARGLVADPGAVGGPVDLDGICAAAGVDVRERPLGGAEGTREALLIPVEDDRFAIAVDPTPRGGWESVPTPLRVGLRRQRLRFRVGHELGHCLVYRRGCGRPKRHLFDSAAQERFCDRFSGFLLVPPPAAASTSPTVDGLLALQARFDVSLQVAAQALSDAHPEAALGIWFAGEKGELRPQWSNRRGAPVPESQLRAAVERGEPTVRWLAERRQLVMVGAPLRGEAVPALPPRPAPIAP